jgi:hypothetical protein
MTHNSSFLRTFLFILALFALGVISFAAAQIAQFALTIDQVMTTQELRETGVNTLSPVQREALNVWLNRYTPQLLTYIVDIFNIISIAATTRA